MENPDFLCVSLSDIGGHFEESAPSVVSAFFAAFRAMEWDNFEIRLTAEDGVGVRRWFSHESDLVFFDDFIEPRLMPDHIADSDHRLYDEDFAGSLERVHKAMLMVLVRHRIAHEGGD